MTQINWRPFRTPIVLIVVICSLALLAHWGWKNVLAPLPGQAEPTCVPQQVNELRTDQVNVRVLNGGTKRGLAKTVAEALKSAGFKVAKTGNTDEIIAETVIVGAKKDNPEVLLLAGFFKNPVIREDGRDNGTVDLLVGNKYTTWNDKAPRSIKVPGETVCLPPNTPAPTPAAKPTG